MEEKDAENIQNPGKNAFLYLPKKENINPIIFNIFS